MPVETQAPPPPIIYAPPTEPFLTVLYHDGCVIAVAKPSGLLSVPGRGPTLADCIEARVTDRFPGATIVHRLDLETSGVLVMARNPAAHRHISRQFEQRQITKTYIARVAGHPPGDTGEINAPLICDWPNRPRQIVDAERGRAAHTAWRVIERERTATRVHLSPTTGRSHQLRVHMLSIGHPILGDSLYAPTAFRTAAERLQLHAQTLTLLHPSSGDTITFQDPCPF